MTFSSNRYPQSLLWRVGRFLGRSRRRTPTDLRRRPTLESLEERQVLSGYNPTAAEQLFLERLNDARANPAAYGQSIGLDLSTVAPSQPLAFDTRLVQASRLHSQDMNDHNFFSHTGSNGSNPGSRMTAAGYPWNGWAESIAAGFTTPESALQGLIVDAGVPDLGHRRHLLAIDAGFKIHQSVGVGVVQNGSGNYHNYYTVDSGYSADRRPILTGVLYTDANSNGKYDLGEGLGGVTLTVAGVGATTTWGSGGYSFQLSAGTYTVTASGGGLAVPVTRTVTLGTSNVRLNILPAARQPSWQALGGVAETALAAGTNANGSETLFALDTAGVLTARTRGTGGVWGAWENVGSGYTHIAAARNAAGYQDVFALDAAGGLWLRSQLAPGSWGAWSALGGVCKALAAGTNADGSEQVFVLGSDDGVWTRRQAGVGGAWGGWQGLGGVGQQLTAARNGGGRLDVFVIGTDGAMWTRTQTAAGAFAGWASLGGVCQQIAAGVNADGTQQVFTIGTDGSLWTRRQTSAGGAWGGWQSLGGVCQSIAAVLNAGGLLDVFVVGTDSTLYTRAQTAPGAYNGWASLGGTVSTIGTIGRATDGLGEVFVVATDGSVRLWG